MAPNLLLGPLTEIRAKPVDPDEAVSCQTRNLTMDVEGTSEVVVDRGSNPLTSTIFKSRRADRKSDRIRERRVGRNQPPPCRFESCLRLHFSP